MRGTLMGVVGFHSQVSRISARAALKFAARSGTGRGIFGTHPPQRLKDHVLFLL